MYPYKNQTTYDTSGKRVRLLMWNFIRNVSVCPKWKGAQEFVIIPPGMWDLSSPSSIAFG